MRPPVRSPRIRSPDDKTFIERWRTRFFVGLGLARRPMTLGVKALVTDGARVLLVRHTYVRGWHLPGGGVERGETVWAAVEKEVAEESTVRLTARPVLRGVMRNPRTSPFDHIVYFECRDWEEGGAFAPNYEIAESRFFPLDALPEGAVQSTHDRVSEFVEGRDAPDVW